MEQTSAPTPMPENVAEARERFIALWGQMGANWGIPRTMAEVHALLFIAGEPMNTDAVMAALDISRGNASMTLRNLVDWGIVHRVHVRGDRKEYFKAEQDVWKLFRIILRERKKRELDPMLESLRACRELTKSSENADESRKLDPTSAIEKAHHARFDELLGVLSLIDAMSQQLIDPGDGSDEGLHMAAKLLEHAS